LITRWRENPSQLKLSLDPLSFENQFSISRHFVIFNSVIFVHNINGHVGTRSFFTLNAQQQEKLHTAVLSKIGARDFMSLLALHNFTTFLLECLTLAHGLNVCA
jgi:hypothetical protein